jgi:hypothetical protein
MPWLENASCLLHSNGNWWITHLTHFHLFLNLKRFLTGKKFDSDDILNERSEMAHVYLVAHFHEQSTQNFVSCYNCLIVGGTYVEKYTKVCRIP